MKNKFSFSQFIVPDFKIKLVFMLSAIFFMGVTLSVLIEIGWGTDPATFMNLHIASLFGWENVGTAQIIDYGILFIFNFIFGPQYIGFGTLANMFLIGYIADFSRWVWKLTGFHQFLASARLVALIPVFAITLCLFVISASVYINAQMGIAPYDAIPVIISKSAKRIPPFIIRMLFDFSAIFIGLIAAVAARGKFEAVSSFAGIELRTSIIGCVCMSFMLGPVISFAGSIMKKKIPVFQDSTSVR